MCTGWPWPEPSSWQGAPDAGDGHMSVIEARPRELAPEPAPRGRIMLWLTTTDHKKIGILYFINSFAFFAIAGVLALLMRSELARPGTQFLGAKAYNQVFTEHGTLMIFLFILDRKSTRLNSSHSQISYAVF